jgi:hypothetical protein
MFFKKKNHKIDFLVIGTQKGGTTAIDHYLRQHPEIGMGNEKELHFFDNEEIFSKNKINYSQYDNRFDISANKSIYGEVTPIYLYWEPSCKRIWEYNKEIKIIAVLRNPIDRAYSHWNMEVERNAEQEPFFECIVNERARMRASLPYQHRVFSYVDRGFYSEQIRRYKRYFRDEQMLFIKYEDFKNEQEKEVFKILNFLDVNPDKFTFKPETVHKRAYSKKMSDEEREYLRNIYKNDIREVEKLMNWDCQDWLN